MDKMRLYASVLQVVITLIFYVLAWPKFREWKRYYPTILFVMVISLLSGVIQAEFRLWHFHQTYLTANNLTTDLVILFTNYPPTVIGFLGRYPKRGLWVIPYVFGWVALYAGAEIIFYRLDHITYHHGWNAGWSVVIDVLMFICIRLHHSKPLLAWLVVFVFFTIVLFVFQIPILQFK